ncbi:hypothetical protein TraAM80_02588 [Trypanosoma rangeli]|uniref:Uncharacterized protein n=1 Tax=Trypanosoma rangeli TaxID=5698 RepID=A0A3R7KJF2_TRYRA|nr:uncharacterized protein TraAM80_02588 [Trypanosoma rangeli]RNF08745.1 hypothetical protein TraAM80_02588 [Trypanosoma rangeli]|eukprot:RNF08745.1 hypothetical protein TraAM80_02588 [Trypanosoma rangeli]
MGPVTATALDTAMSSATVTAVPVSRSLTSSATLVPPSPERTVTASERYSVTPTVPSLPALVVWIDVYFEVESTALTPVKLVALLRQVVWNNKSINMVGGSIFADTWDQILFESVSHACQALAAANKGKLLGVLNASYSPPVTPTHKNSGYIVVIVAVGVVIVIIALFVAGALCHRRHQDKRWRLSRYDEDFAMNSATAPLNLNELLLRNRGANFRNSQDHKLVTL